MLSKKKAIAAGQLVLIIVTIVSFLLIFVTVSKLVEKADSKDAELLCHNSIALRISSAVSALGTEIKTVPNLCKTIDKKIDGDREEIKAQVAYMMSRCWWMFNEGRAEQILEDTSPLTISRDIFNLAKTGNDCFLCYGVIIDESDISGGDISIREMTNYMRETNYPSIKNSKYLDYIQSFAGSGKIAVLDKIKPQNTYGIVFMSRNDADAGWWGEGDNVIPTSSEAGSLEAIKAKREFYGSEERDVSIIAFDNIKDISASGCAVRDFAGE
jgi:hypothetical protein